MPQRGQDGARAELDIQQDILWLALLPRHVQHSTMFSGCPQHLSRHGCQTLPSAAKGHECETGEQKTRSQKITTLLSCSQCLHYQKSVFHPSDNLTGLFDFNERQRLV